MSRSNKGSGSTKRRIDTKSPHSEHAIPSQDRVSPRQLSQMVSAVPVLLHWLRDNDERPGALFLRDANPDKLTPALQILLNTLLYDGDVSILQVRELGETYGAEVWASAIRLILTESDPPLIPYEVAHTLSKSLTRLEAAKTATDCAKVLGPILDALPKSSYFALAELCALLRDATEASSQLACLCGPMLLATFTSEDMSEQQQNAAAMAIMDLLIEECETIFGRAAARSNRSGLGARKEKKQSQTRKPDRDSPQSSRSPATGSKNRGSLRLSASPLRLPGSSRERGNGSARDASTEKKKKKKKKKRPELTLDRDDGTEPPPPPPPNEHGSDDGDGDDDDDDDEGEDEPPKSSRLSRRNVKSSSSSRSKGSRSSRRGSYIPNTTNDEAVDAQRRQALRTFYLWRDPPKAERVDALFDNYSFPDVAQSIHAKYGMLPPGWRQDLQDQIERGEQIDWLTGGDPNASPGAGKGTPSNGAGGFLRRFSMARGPNKNSPRESVSMVQIESQLLEGAHNVVDEIVDSEQYFHDTLDSLLTTFAKNLRDCATGRLGREKQQALGITADQVESLFGWRLEAVVETSARLLEKLDVVGLVRATPKDPAGRPGLVAKAFVECAEDLGVYVPFAENHKNALSILREASKEYKQNGGKRGTTTSVHSANSSANDETINLRDLQPMHFMELWDHASAQSDSKLRNQSLQSLLISPVQRVPRYKLLLAELLKQVPENHVSRTSVKEALDVVTETADLIDSALGASNAESKSAAG